MTLNEFINHIKHNSLTINIFEKPYDELDFHKIHFLGSVGEFKTAVIKRYIGEWRILKIEPLEFELNIYIKEN